jgi:hypothetical protein
MEGRTFGDVPLSVGMHRGLAGSLEGPSSYVMKWPPASGSCGG